MTIDRRTLIGAGLAAPALLTLGVRASAATAGYPFTLGVASGEPAADGMVLWTRLALQPLAPDGGMPAQPVAVRWELAEDEAFARIVRRGEVRADPAWGHSVHVELTGLRPARSYWYRFIAGGEASPIGRTRTAPAKGATPERARFVFASCQNWEVGHYAAHRHIVADDPDLILFLGDYIYEAAPGEGRLRLHPPEETKDIGGYRVRYGCYKSDKWLQAAHQAAPWAVTWDDHEVVNDYADDLDELNSDPAVTLRRRAAAYQAYWEHMPLRAAARPDGPAMHLYRTLDWGALAQFQIIDDRQYRAPRACQPPELLARRVKYKNMLSDCPELRDPARTMLGQAQEHWLDAVLGNTRARWNLLAQQTIMTQLKRVDPGNAANPERLTSADTWSGYPAARDKLFRRWATARTPNPIALGGDIHSFIAADVRDPARPDGPPIGSEFVGGSISSLHHDPALKQEASESGIRFAEYEKRGYGRADLTRDRAEVTLRAVEDATKEDSPASDLAKFTIEAGRPGLQA